MVAEEYTTAVQIAEGLLAQTGVETPLQVNESHGIEGEKYHWELSVTPYEFNPNNVDFDKLRVSLFKVKVVVTWDNRQVNLVTIKLANKLI